MSLKMAQTHYCMEGVIWLDAMDVRMSTLQLGYCVWGVLRVSVGHPLTMGDGDSMEGMFLSKPHHHWQVFLCRALQGTIIL